MTCIGFALGLALIWCEPPKSNAVVVKCPPMIEYQIATQRKAAYELRKLGSNSAAGRLIADYGTIRKRCRAYESAN